jgi:hypothetical protein
VSENTIWILVGVGCGIIFLLVIVCLWRRHKKMEEEEYNKIKRTAESGKVHDD